jgi:hypothetical protein
MSTGSEWRKSSYSTDTGGSCVEVGHWRKSSHSDSTGGSCVEVGHWHKSSHSTDTGGNCVEVGHWHKSSHSSSTRGDCVEVSAPGNILVRDTTDRTGPALAFRPTAWRHFLTTLR